MPENKPDRISKMVLKEFYRRTVRDIDQLISSTSVVLSARDTSFLMMALDSFKKIQEPEKSEKPIISADDVAFKFDVEA